MDRKCSDCGNVGHTSGTCAGLKLFGFHFPFSSSSAVATTTKNVSVDCLASSPSSLSSSRVATEENFDTPADGYLSDGPVPGGIAWTEEEHRSFLVGLEKLGKGHWTRISREYVKTRTPAQVCNHAHGYFRRQKALDKKRRSRLFDT